MDFTCCMETCEGLKALYGAIERRCIRLVWLCIWCCCCDEMSLRPRICGFALMASRDAHRD